MNSEHPVVKKYDKMASIYDRIYHIYLKGTMAVALNLLRPNGRERILDVGCGTGELERHVMAVHPAQAIVGVDLTEAMLVRARQKLAAYPHVVFHQGSGAQLPFGPGTFDCVITCSAFHYMRDPEQVLAECMRVLVPGGRFILIDWTRDHWHGRVYDWYRRLTYPAHYKVYSSQQLRDMCGKVGLQVQTVSPFSVAWFWTMMTVTAVKN